MDDTQRLIHEEVIPKIYAINKKKPILVGINGVDGAGKSFFTHTLTEALGNFPRTIVSVCVDDFLHSAEVRYRKGKDSPVGFYLDSYNYDLLKEYLLDPFLKGEGVYRSVAFDCAKDQAIHTAPKPIPSNAILILEGIFLFRPKLLPYWDLKIFLDVSFETSLQRNVQRSGKKEPEAIQRIVKRCEQRYIPGQKIYFKEVNPKSKTDICIDNNDFLHPFIINEI